MFDTTVLLEKIHFSLCKFEENLEQDKKRNEENLLKTDKMLIDTEKQRLWFERKLIEKESKNARTK